MGSVDGAALQRGQVVWVSALDERGENEKERPHVILDSNRDIKLYPNQVTGICGTSAPHDPTDDKFVYIGGPNCGPDHVTLPRDTWVNTEWFNSFCCTTVSVVHGRVSKGCRAELLRKSQSRLDQLRAERRA